MKKILAVLAMTFAFAASAVQAPASAPVAVKTAQPAVQAQVNKTKIVARNKKLAKATKPKAAASAAK